MALTFSEALKKLRESSKNQSVRRIKLVNGEILECIIKETYEDIIVVEKAPQGAAGAAKYTIPVSSILYISDCELS